MRRNQKAPLSPRSSAFCLYAEKEAEYSTFTEILCIILPEKKAEDSIFLHIPPDPLHSISTLPEKKAEYSTFTQILCILPHLATAAEGPAQT
jgi:hypothetical protein